MSSSASEEELRAAYEAELERISCADLMLQAAVSLLNVGGRRLEAAAGERAGAHEQGASAGAPGELEQVRDAIDGVRALLGVLERRFSKELGPLRDALSQLQLAYARQAQAPGQSAAQSAAPAGTDEQASPAGASGGPAPQGHGPGGRRPGPAESSGRLWVPGR